MLNDEVLILPVDDVQVGPVVSTRQYEDKPEWGIVLKVGPGRVTESGYMVYPGVAEGDIVVYGAYAVTKVRSQGVDYFIVKADDIKSKYVGTGD